MSLGAAFFVALLSAQGTHGEPLDSLAALEPTTDDSWMQGTPILPDPVQPPSSLSLLQASTSGDDCAEQERFDVVMCSSHMCTDCALEWCFKSCQKIQTDYPTCRCADWPSSRKTYSGEGWAGAGKYGDQGEYSSGDYLQVRAAHSDSKQAFPSLALLEMGAGAAGGDYPHKLSPSLEPESHDKFFDHDYPDDARVAMHKGFNFQHPYPVVQDSEDYDKDYTKDENSDGGQWAAQNKYDTLRAKKSEKVLAAKRAWATEADLEKALDEAKKNRAAAEAAAKEAQQKADDAKAAAAAAEEKAKALSSTEAMSSEIDSAVKAVEGDVTTLEDCKKKLAEAKEHLKGLMKEKEDHEGVRAVEAEQAQARALANAEQAEALSKEAAEKAAKSASLNEKAPEEEATLSTKISEAAAKADAAEAEARKGDGELARAAVHLRGVRHSEVDDDGGVYYHHPPLPPAPAPYVAPAPRPTLPPPPAPKSGAVATRVSALLVSLLAAVAATAAF